MSSIKHKHYCANCGKLFPHITVKYSGLLLCSVECKVKYELGLKNGEEPNIVY